MVLCHFYVWFLFCLVVAQAVEEMWFLEWQLPFAYLFLVSSLSVCFFLFASLRDIFKPTWFIEISEFEVWELYIVLNTKA